MAQKVIIGALVIAAWMCAYPPFFIEWRGGRVSKGYHFFFKPPSEMEQVDLSRLIVQFIFLAVATSAVVLLVRSGTKKDS